MNLQHERWAQMVSDVSEYGFSGDAFVVSQANARKLLTRQHAAFVRLVKKANRYAFNPREGTVKADQQGTWVYLDDILAALEKQGGKK